MRERGWWSDEEDEALRKGERKALLKALAQVKGGGHGCIHQRLVCLLVRVGLWLTHELHLLSVAFCQAEKKPKPGMEDLFSDVYAEQPKLLKVCTLAGPSPPPCCPAIVGGAERSRMRVFSHHWTALWACLFVCVTGASTSAARTRCQVPGCLH